ncbi:MAG TPA: TRAM domain-containing protein [Gemmatimonadales bacterium]
MTAPPVRIERLAAGGDGVGHLADGRVVFVPRTAPGELVALRDLKPSRRFARARVAAILEPSPDRVEPRCAHYTADDCGGCQLQHVAAPVQRTARAAFVGDALRRLGRLDVPDPLLEPAEHEFGYRSKLTLAATPDGRRIGLHPLDRPDAVFQLDRCHLAAEPLMELWTVLRRQRALMPPGLDRLVLRLDRAGGRHVIANVRGTTVWTQAPMLAAELDRAHVPTALWWRPEGGVARVLAGRANGAPAPVFEQVNPAMGDRVRAFAVDRLGPVHDAEVWDLYAGIGETTAVLAAAGARVESVERDQRAVAHAEGAGPAARRHAGPAEATVGRLEPPDLVLTNPPRTGMEAAVTAAIAAGRPRRIVYVSCDPATLARDIVRLGSGFRLVEARAFDLFPQTAHVETVAVLDRV